MELPPSSLRARRAPSSIGQRCSLGLAVAALLVGGCTNGDDGALDLPDQLVAADEVSGDVSESATGAGSGSGGIGSQGDDDGFIEGFEPVQDVETEPLEPPEPETVDLTADAPSVVIEEIANQVADSDDGEELLDAVGPIDRAEAPKGEADGQIRNGVGEPVVLDEAASLACAKIEIAIGQIDAGLPAVANEFVLSGADQAETSAIGDIQAWVGPLRAVVDSGSIDDPTALVGFLSVCTEGGYEL